MMVRQGFLKRATSFMLALVMAFGLLGIYPSVFAANTALEEETVPTVDSSLQPLYQEIVVSPGQLVGETCEIVENEIYGYVVDYELKKGHALSISDTNYVFSVRRLVDGNYSTMLKQATTASFTATEDMTVGMLIRKPDKSALTDEELASVVIYDSQYGMIGVEGYVQRFTVEAETIDGGTATTRANIFLPESYSETGVPTRLIVMTNGHSAYLTDSVWNKNTADNVGIIRNYLNAGYAVYVVDNTAGRTSKTPDIGCPQLVSSYRKAYEYIQQHFNVEEKISIHSRSFGTFAAVRLMKEIPELIKCAVMTGARVSVKQEWPGLDKKHIANRFGFTDTTGATYEADKMVGHDPYVDVDGDSYALPPTYWVLCEGDATAKPLEFIEKLIAHGNDVTSVTHTGTDHTGVCTLNTEEMFSSALTFLNEHQDTAESKAPEESHTHSYESALTAPTCTEQGYTTYTCTCGDSYVDTYVDAAGHSYESGICTGCGESIPQPNWEQGTILAATGLEKDTAKVIRTADYLHISDYVGMTLNAGHYITYFVYDAQYNYLGNGKADLTANFLLSGQGISTHEMKIRYPEGVYFRIALWRGKSSTMTPEMLNEAGVEFLDATHDPIFWEMGSIYAASGIAFVREQVIRSVNYLPVENYAGVTVADGYAISFLAYDENLNYLGNGNPEKKGYFIPARVTMQEIVTQYPDTKYIRLLLVEDPLADFTMDAVELSDIRIYRAGETVPEKTYPYQGLESSFEVDFAHGLLDVNNGTYHCTDSGFVTTMTIPLENISEISWKNDYVILWGAYDEQNEYLGSCASYLTSGEVTKADILAVYGEASYIAVSVKPASQKNLELAEMVKESGLTIHHDLSYTGSLAYDTVMQAQKSQDGAIYNNTLFLFDKYGQCTVYDTDSKLKLGSFTLDKVDILNPHANSVCFSDMFYEESDSFPLLYVNIYNNYWTTDDRKEGTCCVYRIFEENGTYSTKLVQVLKIGFTDDYDLWNSAEGNGYHYYLPYGNFIVDTDENKLWAFVLRNGDNQTRFFQFDLPDMSDGIYNETYDCNLVTLEASDIEDMFDLEHFEILQGCTYANGKIYSANGLGTSSSYNAFAQLKVVDLRSKSVVAVVDFSTLGFGLEPEMISFNVGGDEQLYYLSIDGTLRRLRFVDDLFNTTSVNGRNAHTYEDGICTGCGEEMPSFEGKTVSVLSHSMSTYAGVSNSTAANSTIGNNDVYYTEGRHGVYQKDTWWQQVIDALGMELLVNNSWSGSCVFMPRKGEASVGYGDRAVNLHNDRTGEEPDVIFVYLGCNDFAYYKDSFGKAADVDYAALIRENDDGTFSYSAPQTTCEAYAIMLHKVENRYPDTQIYCMTSTARRDPDYAGDSYPDAGQPTAFSAELIKIAQHFGFPVINLENAIPKEAEIFDQYIGDKRAHSNALGMDQITNEVLSVMLGKDAEIRHVTCESDVIPEQAVLLGGSYSAEVDLTEDYTISVIMNGTDVTAEVCSDGRIFIEEVTGDIVVEAIRGAADFRWEMVNNELVSVGDDPNPLEKLEGTVTDSVISGGRYELTTSVILKHDRPWVLEWKCAEDWRGIFLSSAPAKQTNGMYYISRTKGGQLCFGTWTGTQHNNYGIDLSKLDAQTHTYRLVNRIAADGSNMIWLYVDGTEIGPMNNYYVGSNSQNATSDWVSGKDFTFTYIGTEGTPLNTCALDFIQAWEGGVQSFTGKTLSILGDSISTMSGVSNDTSANSTIGKNAVYYSGSSAGVTWADTWWQQAIDALDMELLVNNSWSGSCILHTRSNTAGAYADRCVQLHNDHTGEEPDVIAVFMGTNDFSYYQTKLGTSDAIDYDTLITDNGDGTFAYADPATSCEAYAIMLHKMTMRYPDAEIYCMTLTARRDPDKEDSYADVGQPTVFNGELAKVIDRFGATVVDLENCGITKDAEIFDTYMADGRVHPNAAGMDQISMALISAMLGTETKIYDVSADLTGVASDNDTRSVLSGNGYTAALTGKGSDADMDVTVTMGGVDVTNCVYANGLITIESVTGDIVITAVDNTPDNYRWELDGSGLVSVAGSENSENVLTIQGGSVSDGALMNAYYLLDEKVILRHDRTWAVEWKASGNWSGMLFSAGKSAGADGNTYLFKTTSDSGFIGFGERTGGQYNNYGIALSARGVDTTAEHTYRLENRIASDGSNMVYLLVDGVDHGAMNHYFVGGTTDQGVTVDWISEKDLTFSYIGASGHAMNNCSIDYIQVWEGGLTHAQPQSQGVANAIERAYRLTDVEWTPVKNMPGVVLEDGVWSYQEFKAGTQYEGVPYSGVIGTDTYIGLNVSLNSFATALQNENSVLYTENLFADSYPKKASYFGTVCSKFAQYVLNIPGSYNTANIPNIPGMDTIALPGEYGVDDIRLGDVIVDTSYHTAVCTDILYTPGGEVAYLEIAEAMPPTVRRLWWSAEEFFGAFPNYRLCRYQHIEAVPAADEVAVGEYALMPRYGDKYNYSVSSTAGVADILETGYAKAVILRDGAVVDEIAVDDTTETVSFDRSVPGYLEMYLEKADGTRSGSVYACVVDSSVKVTDSVSFLNGTLAVDTTGTSGTPLYVQVGSGQSLFCALNGEQTAEISFNSSRVSDYRVRVAYENEYGIYLSKWVSFEVDLSAGTGPNPSSDPYLSRGVYWDGYNLTPTSAVPSIQENKQDYWSYTMVPVEGGTAYYSEGATRMWYLDGDGNPISTYNAYKDSAVPFRFIPPAGAAYVSIAYSPELVEKGTECLLKVMEMSLRYDDHYDVTGKTVEIIDAGTPTSYQVGYGVEENAVPDIAVVTLEGDTLVATGIGTAMVRIDAKLYEVTVTAAPLSVFLMLGQSNMEGNEGNASQSVANENGQVYSTYGAYGSLTTETAPQFVPSALAGAYSTVNSQGGTQYLASHPVNSLTEAGNGKIGMDSAIAYQWNKLTGDKVWTVNAAHSGSAISSWQNGASNFNEFAAMFEAVKATLQAELAAGHYTLENFGYFWCQGCAETTNTAQVYEEKYLAMHEALKQLCTFDHDGNADTADTTLEFAGLVPIRSGRSYESKYREGTYADTTSAPYYESFLDLQMSGPRVAQFHMGNDPALADVHLVWGDGSEWVTMPDGTNGVSEYFQMYYANGKVDYPTQITQSDSWRTPTTAAAMHDSIHYNQIGYNEIGIRASENLAYTLGRVEAPDEEVTVKLLSWDGYHEVISLEASVSGNSKTLVVPVVAPIYKSKTVTYTASESLSYEYYDLIANTETVTGTLTAVGAQGSIAVTEYIPPEPVNYRWEFDGTDLVSVTTNGNRENTITRTTGTVTDGVISLGQYSMESAIELRHDRPWALEWKTSGIASDATGGILLFSEAEKSATTGAKYVYFNLNKGICSMGYYTGSTHLQYGVSLKSAGITATEEHTYRLTNRITADGTNMVWLYVDGNEIAPMNQCYQGGSSALNKKENWVSGKNFSFAYSGTPENDIYDCKIFYLQAWEGGEKAESLSTRYDDHLDMTDKVVEIVDAGKPISYQVGYGIEENAVLDTAVVTLEGETLIATGIGSALVRIDGQLYEVTVTAAPISLLLLAGQSNMQGSEGDANQSIVCPEGMVYSTYGDRYTMTVNNATNYAPSALTGNGSALNVNGNTTNLSDWPVYLLNESGVGKAGPDSGFAYEWVQQTGEKVWVVNAAHGGTNISAWQDGGTQYEECVLLFQACQETLRKEITAGHYTLSHMGYFWCQGCANYSNTAQWYVEKYLAMHENFKTELAFDHDSDPATADKTFEFGGIIPVRAGHEYYTSYRQGVYADTTTAKYHESFKDLRFTGPRVAQYWMTNNPELPDIWNVCNIGEDWVTMPNGTDGVAEYFQSHYKNGTVDYTTQVKQSSSWYTPTTPAAVHDSIHYNQIGYNEVGREAARNALINLGEIEAPEVEPTVELLTWDGYTNADRISASTTGASGTLVVPIVYPVWKSKEVTYTVSEGLIYEYYDLLTNNIQTTGTLTAVGAETQPVTVEKAAPYGHFIDHLSSLPEEVCCGLNLWSVLEHDNYYYANGTGWGIHSSGNVPSVTIFVNPGDRIFATSFGKAGENGHTSTNGIRMTFFSEYDVVKTLTPSETYAQFTANGGYLVAPEGAVAVNIPMWNDNDSNEVYILNWAHDPSNDICSICDKDSHTHNWSEWATVSLPSADAPGTEQRTCEGCGQTEEREVEGVWQKYALADHLSQLPENICCNLNLWTALEHDKYFLSGGTQWGIHSSGTVYSVTIPISAGDQIYASSFGKGGTHGGSANGIRVTFFDAYGVNKTLAPADTYAEFTANGGCLIAPEGTIAVNIPMWNNSGDNELYILNRDHRYIDVVTAPTCTEQGYTTHTCSCGDSHVDSYVDATGHTFTDYRYDAETGKGTAPCEHGCGEHHTVPVHEEASWARTEAGLLGEEYGVGFMLVALYDVNGRMVTSKWCEREQWMLSGNTVICRFSAPEFAGEDLAQAEDILRFNFDENYVPIRQAKEIP